MILHEKFITKTDLDQIEKYADKVFAKVGIDIEFTRHFLDRVNDERNRRQITVQELIRLFKQTYAKHGKKIAQLGPDAEAVIKDMRTDINMPFVLNWNNRDQEFELVAKTIMRKKNFRTPNPELYVEKKKKKTFNELRINKPSNPDGIKRINMPQISSKDYPEYFEYMAKKGFERSTKNVDVKKLKPVQSEFGDKGILKSLGFLAKQKDANKPIIISSDNYVIDGNHRWLAALNANRKTIPAIVLRGNHKDILDATLKFPKTYFKAVQV